MPAASGGTLRTRSARWLTSAALLLSNAACGEALTPDPQLTLEITRPGPDDTLLIGDTLWLEAAVREVGGDVEPRIGVAWTLNEGFPLVRGHPPHAIMLDTGLHRVRARAQKPNGADLTATRTVTVLENFPPSIEAVGPVPAVAYDFDTVTLIVSARDAEGPVRVRWYSDRAGLIGEGDTVRWSPDPSGLHVIRVRVSDAQGLSTFTIAGAIQVASSEPFLWSRLFPDDWGYMLAMSDQGVLYANVGCVLTCVSALDRSGAILWTQPLEQLFWDHASGLTIAPDGRIFATDFWGIGYAFSPDGALLWQNTILGHDQHGRLALGPDGALYASGDDDRGRTMLGLVRVDPNTGADVWRISTPSFRSGPTILADGRIAAESDEHFWTDSDGNIVLATPSGYPRSGQYMAAGDWEGNLLVPNRGVGLTRFNQAGGVDYTVDFGRRTGEPVVAFDGTAYASIDGIVKAIGPTGAVLWSTQVPGWSWISRYALLADGTLLVTEGRWFHRLDAATGVVLESIELAAPIESGLVVADDGTVYFLTSETRLIALPGWAPLAPDSPWSIWRRDNRRTASVPRP